MMYVVKVVSSILGSAVGLILISFTCTKVASLYMKRKNENEHKAKQKVHERGLQCLTDFQLPISLDNFFDHVSQMKFSENKGFEKEFAKLDTDRSLSYSVGSRPCNNIKNRFTNIPTFDDTRVALENIGQKIGSDYINANYVGDLDQSMLHIATQAPLPETIVDFWRMVWEKEVDIIVMIVKLKEKGNSTCTKYWPDESSKEYGNIEVKHIDTVSSAHYVIRRFAVKNIVSLEERIVRHFHYMSWPVGKEIPLHPTDFTEFVQKVCSFRNDNKNPMVVHCSSGTGRTGIFIVIATQLERLQSKGNINVFDNVNRAMDQRCKIIRCLEEYIFIHECILDYLLFRDRIDININNLWDYIIKNNQIGLSGKSGLQTEFHDLSRGVSELNNTTEIGALPENASKNRFEDILPYDHTRVKLSMKIGDGYINANHVNTYTQKRGFIVTQNPIEAILIEFWGMIWENMSQTIIMLSQDDEDIFPYWSDGKETLKAGKIQVRLDNVEELKYFRIRNLRLTHAEANTSRMIRQYQLKTWPDKSNEESLRIFLDFIIQCKQWNHVSGGKTITVHSRTGTGKSGVFVAISNLIDRVDSENVVNVFTTVRKLRQKRTGMIQTLEQYDLLYNVMVHYFKTRYVHRFDKDATTQTVFDSTIQEDNSTLDISNNLEFNTKL